MKLFCAGLLAGALLATGVPASATVLRWYSGEELMSSPESRLLRMGYAAGVSDTLGAVVVLLEGYPDVPLDIHRRALQKISDCLHDRSRGALGQFTDFAELAWRGRDSSAGFLLLQHACE